jgi:ParB-like chromosome segregation protein Spo0J
MAARTLSMKEVPVIVLAHLTDTQRRALVIADNRIGLNAGWDQEMLRVELGALSEHGANLELLGFDDKELKRLIQGLEPLTDADSVPPTPAGYR